MNNRALSDLTTTEFIELVRRVVREELAGKARKKAAVPAPKSEPSAAAVELVRRRLRRAGVAA